MAELPIVVTVETVKDTGLLVRLLRAIADKLAQLATRVEMIAHSTNRTISAAVLRSALQANGATPLNVTDLRGTLADPQPAQVLSYTTNPTGLVLQNLKNNQLIVVTGATDKLYRVVSGNPSTLSQIIAQGAAHDFLSATHTDTVAAVPVLGDLTYANATPKWTKLAGNTAAIQTFLTQTGTGAVSAAPSWFDLFGTANTWTAGQTISSGQLNVPSQFGCSAYRSAALSLTNSTVTAILLDAETYDTGSCHSTSSNTTRITVPTGGGGRWHLVGQIEFSSNATGARLARIKKNGTTVLARCILAPVSGDDTACNVSCYDPLAAAGDYYELEGFQTSGVSLALTVTDSGSVFFQGMKVVG